MRPDYNYRVVWEQGEGYSAQVYVMPQWAALFPARRTHVEAVLDCKLDAGLRSRTPRIDPTVHPKSGGGAT